MLSQPPFDEHIIYIYLYITVDLIFEDFIDKELAVGSCIFQTEGYDFIVVKPFIDDGGFLLIFEYHMNLVIAWECVHKAEHLIY